MSRSLTSGDAVNLATPVLTASASNSFARGPNAPVPGYTGHIPGERAQNGATFAVTGFRALTEHYEKQELAMMKTSTMRTSLATQKPLVPAPCAQTSSLNFMSKSAPAQFTSRPYSRTIGNIPNSAIYLPQGRYRDVGKTYGAASRASAGVLYEERGSMGTTKGATLVGDRTTNQTKPVFDKGARRQWVV
jgi:hypothetical protein